MRTTPIAALGALFGETPLNITLVYSATLAADMLRSPDPWRPGPKHTLLPGEASAALVPETLQEKMPV